MLALLVCGCLPLSFPSLYLAYKIIKKNFLSSLFNQQIALMLVFSGKKFSTYLKSFKVIIKCPSQVSSCLSTWLRRYSEFSVRMNWSAGQTCLWSAWSAPPSTTWAPPGCPPGSTCLSTLLYSGPEISSSSCHDWFNWLFRFTMIKHSKRGRIRND